MSGTREIRPFRIDVPQAELGALVFYGLAAFLRGEVDLVELQNRFGSRRTRT